MQNDPVHPSLEARLPHWLPVDTNFRGAADPLPEVPILASTRLQLELLVQQPVLDLRAVSAVILEDLGATLQILRLIGEEFAVEDGRPTRIEDCIASLNTERWLEAVCAATLAPDRRLSKAWQHASRIGYYAEQLAAKEDGMRPGEGRLVGLLHEVGSLPALLGWQTAEAALGDQILNDEALGAILAEHWRLPSCVLAAIGGSSENEVPSPWAAVLQAAHAQAHQEDACTESGTQNRLG